jgi:hypothetical protein
VQIAVEFRMLTVRARSSDRSVVDSAIWLTGTSHNISSGGILFTPDDLPQGMAVDAPIEMRLLMPRELNPEVSARARCRGRVVRVEPGSITDPARVAATIERYNFERKRRKLAGTNR